MRRKAKTPDRSAMICLEGGLFAMGSERFYPEEAPVRRVRVDPFWIDETPVTNRAFAEFVDQTSYVTNAELAPDPKDYPGMPNEMAQAGSLVFRMSERPVDTSNPSNWWHFQFGANWRHPCGPDSNLNGLDDHPVVHIAYGDAAAYAKWAGKDLPTEAEFEFAARGGMDGADYAWGDELAPGGAVMANYWQGSFPYENLCLDGGGATSPVRSYPPNGHGIFDMVGNVWEWTRDWWSDRFESAGTEGCKPACCVVTNPRGGTLRHSFDPAMPDVKIGRKVLKGGSHLCAENYCQRYRPAARHPEMIDTSTTHIGFRCVLRKQR